MSELILYAFVAWVLLCTVGTVLAVRLMHAGFFLFGLLAGLGALFIIAGADFVGVGQLMVYAGGILILIVFGIMLTDGPAGKPASAGTAYRLLGLLLSCTIAGALVYTGFNSPFPGAQVVPESGSVGEALGYELLAKHSLSLEIGGIMLTVALIMAAKTAGKLKKVKD